MYEFSEASFDIEKSYEYILSIQVSLDGFSFSIIRPTDNVLLHFKSIPLKISSHTLIARRFKEWVESEELVQKPFKKVRVIVFSEKFTLVPVAFQDKDLNGDVLHLLFQNADTLQFAENLIKKLNAKLLFAIPEGFTQVLNDSIGEYEINHPLKLVFNGLLTTGEDEKLFLQFHGNIIYLVIFKNNVPVLVNSFKINHVNDIIYFILSSSKQLELNLGETKLFYTGKSKFMSDAILNLEKRCATTEQLSTIKITNTGDLTEEILSENLSLFL